MCVFVKKENLLSLVGKKLNIGFNNLTTLASRLAALPTTFVDKLEFV